MKNATYATAQAMTDILRHYESRGNIRGMEGLFSRTLALLRSDGLNYPTIYAMAGRLSPGLAVADWEILMMDLEDWEAQAINNHKLSGA